MEPLYYGQIKTYQSHISHCFVDLERKIAQPFNPRSFTFHSDNEYLYFSEFYTFHSYIKSPDDSEYKNIDELIQCRYGGLEHINENGCVSVLLKCEQLKDGQTIFTPATEKDVFTGIITYNKNYTSDLSDKELEEVLLDMVDDWNDYINENEYCYITIRDIEGRYIDCMAAEIKEDGNYINDILYVGKVLGLDLSDIAYTEHSYEEER